MKNIFYFLFFFTSILTACSSNEKVKEDDVFTSDSSTKSNDLSILSKALTFHTSFDNGADADFALGDRRIYSVKTATGEQKPISSEPGLGNPPIVVVPGQGKFGAALGFTKENSHVVFYKAEKNVAYSKKGFNGSISLWLRLDPQQIPQTYTDPLQLTDKDYSNSAIWIDFTKNDTPSDFRVGIFGDQKVWDKKNKKEYSEEFFWRLLKIARPPFSRDKWTHVVISWENLNTEQAGRGKLYFDGKFQGETGGIREPFVWNLSEATIRLGTGPYIGIIDDIAIFNRSLTNEEVQSLYELEGGVSGLHE